MLSFTSYVAFILDFESLHCAADIDFRQGLDRISDANIPHSDERLV